MSLFCCQAFYVYQFFAAFSHFKLVSPELSMLSIVSHLNRWRKFSLTRLTYVVKYFMSTNFCRYLNVFICRFNYLLISVTVLSVVSATAFIYYHLELSLSTLMLTKNNYINCNIKCRAYFGNSIVYWKDFCCLWL